MLSENEYQKILSALKDLLSSSCDYAQERLVKRVINLVILSNNRIVRMIN